MKQNRFYANFMCTYEKVRIVLLIHNSVVTLTPEYLHQAKRRSKIKTTIDVITPTPYKRKGLERLLRLNLSFFSGRLEESGAEQRYGGGKKVVIQRFKRPIWLNNNSLEIKGVNFSWQIKYFKLMLIYPDSFILRLLGYFIIIGHGRTHR